MVFIEPFWGSVSAPCSLPGFHSVIRIESGRSSGDSRPCIRFV